MFALSRDATIYTFAEVSHNVMTNFNRNLSDCSFYDCFEFWNGLWLGFIYPVLEISPQKKIWGLRSGEWGDQKKSRPLLITRVLKWSFNHTILILAMWGVVPSCWNQSIFLPGATPHIARISMAWLKDHFTTRGYLKDRVHIKPSHNPFQNSKQS